jgi:hypothetical protein
VIRNGLNHFDARLLLSSGEGFGRELIEERGFRVMFERKEFLSS